MLRLDNLLNVLDSNLNLTLTIISNNEQIVTFNASAGVWPINQALVGEEVERIGVESADHFNIYLATVPPTP